MPFQTSLRLVHKSRHSPSTPLCSDEDSWNPDPSHPSRFCGFQMLGTCSGNKRTVGNKRPHVHGMLCPSIGTEVCFSRRIDRSFLNEGALSFHEYGKKMLLSNEQNQERRVGERADNRMGKKILLCFWFCDLVLGCFSFKPCPHEQSWQGSGQRSQLTSHSFFSFMKASPISVSKFPKFIL